MQKSYVGLDALRGVAALVVVVDHLFFALNANGDASFHGFLAVDLFFMISGFVIAHAYNDRLSSGTLSLRGFVWVRLVRLWPLAALGTLAGYIVGLITHEGAPLTLLASVPLTLLLLPNFFTSCASIFPLDVPLWSLSNEFYGNVIYAAFAGDRLVTTRRLLFISTAGIFALILIALHSTFSKTLDTKGFTDGVARFVFAFPLGVVAYRLSVRLTAAGQWLAKLGLPTLCAIMLASFIAPAVLPLKFSPMWDLAVTVGILPLIMLGGVHVKLGGRSTRALSILGNLSYPLYTLHMPAMYLAWKLSHGIWTIPALGLAALLVGLAGRHLFDKPLQRWNRSRLRTSRVKNGLAAI